MAIPLSHLSWISLKRSNLNLSRLTIIAFTKQYVQNSKFHSQEQKQRKHDKNPKRFLTYTALATSISCVLYNWKDDIRKQIKNLGTNLPTIHAISLPPPGVNVNRNKYNFIADVVEISAPSVVYIEIQDHKRIDFFTGKPATTSNGSGFIVQQDGLILTNAHVVINKPNVSVKVRLHDGSTFTGIVEDVDMQSDLATVRINKTNLPVMKLGSSSNIRPGEFVVAIGSPLALSNTITSGVVSSVNRPSEELGLHNNKHMGYIQTDAAITFGNSGGPLVNLDGEAIGINAMKVTAGISFAIPIDYAKDFLTKAESRRKSKGAQKIVDIPRKRYMGITMLTLTPDILFEMQQKSGSIPSAVRHGVLVWKVMLGSPAYNSGLQPGDIITHVNGDPVMAAVNIYKILEKPGSLQLEIVRKGQVLYINVDPEDI